MSELQLVGLRTGEERTLWEWTGDEPKPGALLTHGEPTNPTRFVAGTASWDSGGRVFTLDVTSATSNPVRHPPIPTHVVFADSDMVV